MLSVNDDYPHTEGECLRVIAEQLKRIADKLCAPADDEYRYDIFGMPHKKEAKCQHEELSGK